MKDKSSKILSVFLCFLLVFGQTGFAQVVGELDISSHLLGLHSSFIKDTFRPLHLRYISYDTLNNNFNLLLDKGDLKPDELKEQDRLNEQTKELLNYFFIGITLPNEKFWVNLRPDAEDNIIDPELARTDIGRIFLEADLQLKKDTANFTSPQTPEGREYWNKLYKKAEELYGTDTVTIPTLTRPWIVPGEIIIRETKGQSPKGTVPELASAYVYKATLKVMLEQDYLKDSSTYAFKDERSKALNEYSSHLIRELIIPKIIKEVNSAKRYAPLRQVYYSLILAQWFKQKFQGKTGTYSNLIDQSNLSGLISKTLWSKTTYFQEYQKSFQQGEYNIKEPVYRPTGQIIRSYFSGGIKIDYAPLMVIKNSASPVANKPYLVPMIISAKGEFVSSPVINQQEIEDSEKKPVASHESIAYGSHPDIKSDLLYTNPGVPSLDIEMKRSDAINLYLFSLSPDIIKNLETGLRDSEWRVRQACAQALGIIVSRIDLPRCQVYKNLVQRKLGRFVTKEDIFFIISSLSDNLLLQDRIDSEESAVDFVLQERYPLFKEAKEEFRRINNAFEGPLKYEEDLFWNSNSFLFNRLINIAPDLGRNYFLYYLSLASEEVSGSHRVAHLFEELRPVLENKEAVVFLSKIISRLPKKQISPAKLLDIFRLAQGCFLLNRQDVLRDLSGENINSVDDLIEQAGRRLLKDLIEVLELRNIKLDAKTTANWISHENPWQAIIAFTTFYRRFKQAGFDQELEIIERMAENVLNGSYAQYRYDNNSQLDMLDDGQKRIWRENSISYPAEHEIDDNSQGKPAQIKDRLKDMIEHGHITDPFILSILRGISDDSAGARASKLLEIIREAGQLMKKQDAAALQKIEYFQEVSAVQQAAAILSKLRISYEILLLFSVSAQDVQNGRITLKKQSAEMSIEKFISGLKDKLIRQNELAAAADIQNILENIIRSKSGYSGKKQVSVEDTDDPFILISIGEKPVSTCQGYNYPSIEFCRCLPAYLGDANKKIVLVRQNGTPVARAVIRLMKTESGKPVIFLENIYSSVASDFKKDILEHILQKKAAAMGVDIATQLDIGGVTARLSTINYLMSTGTRNSYEYSDAKKGKQSGAWKINDRMNLISASYEQKTTASPIQNNHNDLGGVDMRYLAKNTIIENDDAGLLRPENPRLAMTNSPELQEIQRLIQADIIPSIQRLEECRKTCTASALLSCIADILRIEEERVTATDPELNNLLVSLETSRTF